MGLRGDGRHAHRGRPRVPAAQEAGRRVAAVRAERARRGLPPDGGGVSRLGWIFALMLAMRVRELSRRLELVARAEHELRGPLGALGLIAAAAARDPGPPRLAPALESQLDRARGGLADLAAAREGRRARPRPELVPLQRSACAAPAPP